MSLLSPLVQRRSIEDPNLPLSSVALAEWLSGPSSKAGVPVTEQRALGITAYFRAISLLGGTVGQLPRKVFDRQTRERITAKTVLDRPNSIQTPFEFWQTTIANAASWGTGYARKIRDHMDVVTEVWPVHPSRVRVDLFEDRDGRIDKLFIVSMRDGTERRWTTWEMFHLPYLSIDGVTGLAPLRMARETLGINIAAEEYGARFLGQGSSPAGILTTDQDLKPGKADELKSRWREKAVGLANAHEVVVLDNGTTFTPLAIPPEAAQLLATRQWQVSEVARLFGIPPHLLMDMEKSTSWGTGIEQQVIGLVQFTLQPWLTLIEQRITGELLPGGWSAGRWYAEHDINGLLRGDSASRASFYAQMIQWGVFNRNEARVRENLEPVEGLEEFLTPSNMVLVSVDGSITSLAKGGTDAGSSGDA